MRHSWPFARALARLHCDEEGFSLVESLVSIGLILTSTLALAYTASIGFSYEDVARQKQTATGIADQVMEQVRGLAWDRVTTGHLASDLGATRSDLSVTTPDAGYVVTGCAGDASGVYRLFQCPAQVTSSSQPGAGEQVITGALACASGSDCVAPLVRHAGEITQNHLVYSWRVYDTNNCPSSTSTGCTAAAPYRVTVVVTWTGGTRALNKIVELQSLFWSPTGCRSTATHPFAAPCQPFFYGTATANKGDINVTGSIPGTTFQSADLFTSGAQSSVQQEQLSQAQGRFDQSGVTLVDGSGTHSAGGSAAATSAADTDPGTSTALWSRVRCGDAGMACSGGTVSTGLETIASAAAPSGESAESDSTIAAAGTNVCPPPTDTAQIDGKPCGGSRIQQGGTLSAGLQMGVEELGVATLAQVLAPTGPTKTFVDRVMYPSSSLCTPLATGDGCLEESASRVVGTVNVGGLLPGMTAPSGWGGSNAWNGYYFSIVGYQDQVTAAVGSNGTGGSAVPAPTASLSGTLYCWNGISGYNSVSASSATAVSCAPLSLVQAVAGHLVSVSIQATTTPATVTRSPTSAAASITDATAQVTPPSAIITYSIAVDSEPVGDQTVTVNLNTLEASGSYAPAPSSTS